MVGLNMLYPPAKAIALAMRAGQLSYSPNRTLLKSQILKKSPVGDLQNPMKYQALPKYLPPQKTGVSELYVSQNTH
jgi:hypothetical protein